MEDVANNEEYRSSEEVKDSDDDEDLTWIEWFCGLSGHEVFVQVDVDFFKDEFNLTGLWDSVPQSREALEIILYGGDSDYSNDNRNRELAPDLYGLVHARFIITPRGLQLMYDKYISNVFGMCPNSLCNRTPVLPIGLGDAPFEHQAKIFCPRCNEVHHPPESSSLTVLDGACFGTSFPHIFFMQFHTQFSWPPTPIYYKPAIFGFKVHPNTRSIVRKHLMNESTKAENEAKKNQGNTQHTGSVLK